MIVCPQCGFPVLQENHVISEKPFICNRCKWSGPSKDLIIVDSHGDDEEFHKKIVELYIWISSNFGPRLCKKLYELKLLKQPKISDLSRMDAEDKAVVKFSATVLQAAARGAFNGIVEGITKEVTSGDQSRRTVH